MNYLEKMWFSRLLIKIDGWNLLLRFSISFIWSFGLPIILQKALMSVCPTCISFAYLLLNLLDLHLRWAFFEICVFWDDPTADINLFGIHTWCFLLKIARWCLLYLECTVWPRHIPPPIPGSHWSYTSQQVQELWN